MTGGNNSRFWVKRHCRFRQMDRFWTDSQALKVLKDALDDAFEHEGEDEESEELVNAVLDELGCAVNGDLVSVPTSKAGEGKKVEVVREEKKEAVLEDAGSIGGGGVENSNNNGGIDDDLQARLDNLRKT